MNQLKANANALQRAEDEPARAARTEARASVIAQLERRVAIAESKPFKQVKFRMLEMLEDLKKGLLDFTDLVEIYRWQGAERALGGLLGWYDSAQQKLDQLREEQAADDAV